MAVFFKSETVDISLPEGQFDSGPSVTRTVHIQPVSAQAAFDQFGVNVENAYLLMDELSGDGFYATQGRVQWGNKRFSIMADPKVWAHGLPTDHMEVLIIEIRDGSHIPGESLPR